MNDYEEDLDDVLAENRENQPYHWLEQIAQTDHFTAGSGITTKIPPLSWISVMV